MKKDWEEEEEKLKKARKRKSDKTKKMRVSGKSVFGIQKELKKKK
jgi:hypothetical protein